MASKFELQAARDEARRLQRNVNRKKRRLERNKGVNFEHPANKRFDPSVSKEALSKYTLKQVQAAIARMHEFTSRNTQYYGDVKGRVLPPKLVMEYRKAEKAYIQKATKDFMKIADVPAYKGNSKQTVYDVWKQRTPTFGLSNAANTNPLTLKQKKMTGVTNAAALKKLTDSMKERNAPGYTEKQRNAHREQADEMLRRAGLEDERKRIEKLSDEKFDLLWGDHRFADAASLAYELAMRTLRETKKEWYDRLIDNAIMDMDDVIDWAESAKIKGPKGAPKNLRKLAVKEEARARKRDNGGIAKSGINYKLTNRTLKET